MSHRLWTQKLNSLYKLSTTNFSFLLVPSFQLTYVCCNLAKEFKEKSFILCKMQVAFQEKPPLLYICVDWSNNHPFTEYRYLGSPKIKYSIAMSKYNIQASVPVWVCKYTYYSFKIFSCFWLVNHHNQLLLTKYWTNDVKSAARCRLLNRWPRKPGDEVVLFLVSRKTKSEMAKLL